MKLPEPEWSFRIIGVFSLVGTVAMLLWEPELAPVFFGIGLASYGLGYLAGRERRREEEFERWRRDPTTARAWLREFGLDEAEIDAIIERARGDK